MTADLANLQHIMSKRYDDFHKGSKFNEIFDIFGNGIFNTDGLLWKYQRKIAHATFSRPCFQRLLAKTVIDKAEKGLIPVLERACKERIEVDLQDLFVRFTADITFKTIVGHDPCYLSLDLPKIPMLGYLHRAEETILMRYILPESVWKLQRWLGVGHEKRNTQSKEAIDQILMECINQKREEVKIMMKSKKQEPENDKPNVGDDDEAGMDLLTLYIIENYGTPENGFKSSTIFLRDTLLTMISAGQDTTSLALAWFFWLLSQNPKVETKIKQELKESVTNIQGEESNRVEETILKKLVYLHGAVCESLRLYPSVPLNQKVPYEPQVLPSGHKVNPSTLIILNIYAIGRMRSIWGEDCLEFKPERWITEQGTIKQEPSYKFLAFNAGPRICLGKEMALTQIKTAISSIILHNFRFEVIDGQSINPSPSMILSMKNGLKVRISKDASIS